VPFPDRVPDILDAPVDDDEDKIETEEVALIS
jgi:hypothetical protein